MGDGLAAGGYRHRAHRVDQAALAGVSAVRVALVRPGAARPHESRVVRLELARAGRPRPLRRGAHLARAALEPAPGQDRALALEPGSPRWSRDPAGRRDPRPSGVPRVGVAAGGLLAAAVAHRRVRGVSHGGRATLPEVYVSNWYILGGVLLSPDPLRHELPAVLPGRARQHGRPGLLHAQRDGHVVHPARARRQLLRDPAAARPARLLLRPRRARLLDQSPLLPADRGASFHLQPGAVVAAEHGHPLQRGHDGAGVGRDGELAPDLQGRAAARCAGAMRCRSS